MKKPLPSRAEQRRLILDSEAYKSGDSFSKIDAAKICGMSKEAIVPILTTMSEDGQLDIYRGKARGAGGDGITRYKRPPPKLARIPWRTLSNAQLGIEEAVW